MASKKKQKGMVFHQEGTMAPAAETAPEHPSAYFVSQPAKERKGDMEQVSNSVNDEADITAKHNMDASKVGPPAVKHPTNTTSHSNNLPPDSICKGIKVTLDNNNMWNEFFRCQTEMILTKQGSRMFPYCRFRISGLNPSRKYCLIMDVQPLDNSCYKWTGKSWQVAGKAECHVKSQPFPHPESPSSGQHWMQNPVSFYKLKLTDNISEQNGNIILHPMHRYLPRLHVVQTDKTAIDIKLNGSNVVTFTFPQTEFMAVIAYQNSQFAQLKVNYNPFAKGLKEDRSSAWRLKLKLNSDKESIRDGETTAKEQHPVKKSLKSLLANHKPKTSKTTDIKPSLLGDHEKKITTSKDQSTSKVPNKSLCSNSHPAQKLFSELIREAHVSLQRCNVEQLGNSTTHGSEQTNTSTVTLKSHGTDSMSVKSQNETSVRKGETVLTDTKHKEDEHLMYDTKMDSSEGSNVAPSALNQNSPVHSDLRCKPELLSETNLKQHKRPAPLPLPALALFLKQHSTKSKKLKSKLDSPVLSLQSGSLSEPQSSAALSACLSVDHTSGAADLFSSVNGHVTESSSQATGCTGLGVNPNEMAFNCTRQVDKALCPSSLPCVDLNGLRTEKSVLAERALMLLISDNPLGPPLMSTSSTFPPPLDTVLPALKLPQTGAIPESATLPPDSPDKKSLLSYSECSSISFEPLSPPSSPDPLPPLPATLTLELDHSASGSTVKVPESLQNSRNSAASVFKWHTVLPPPEPYNDASFPTFQPTQQALPIVPSFLNSQVSSHPELQPLHTSTAPTAPTFQENEHSLPFPAELSPLTLQLPLSPTFSSLDGDGLSPTPSLTDLVHFFSTDDDLGMGVEFSNTEAVVTSCSPPSTIEAPSQEFSPQVQLIPAKKTTKCKKTSRQQKLGKMIMDQQNEDSTYTRMQPNFEEVEEQLFISFTSKEALRLHIADSEQPDTPTTPEAHLRPATNAANEPAESLGERISALEKNLLRGLRQMKHRQVIHPVLQEVGLKMNLLDPTLAIDLQYLGVRLPIPTPGVSLELLTQELPSTQAAFVSRTGKTTDVTQIKGWREKFTPSEGPPTPSVKPEAGPSSDLPKKNLSAFCSDMLDEYLEHEGKLIDERAASFSQTQVEPVVYELPTRSMSYVRTLDSVLKKQPSSSPTSDLISGFIPPSKRPKLSSKEKNTRRKEDAQLKVPKRNKLRLKPESAPTQEQTVPTVSTLGFPPPSRNTAPHKSKKKHLEFQFTHTKPLTLSSQKAALKERRKLKPKPLSHTLSPLRSTVSLLPVSEDMAPLESDSELGPTDQDIETGRNHRRPVMTRALLRQKDLEDGMVWEGRLRTSITEERAAIALTSLFTLMGFVSENPTAPIQLVRRRAPSCFNEFCRLGCICSSLSHCSRISHCGRPQCMFRCSCLKQKVVLLKNLDGSDSSPSQHQNNKNKNRKRRMKMAYILKEADSVSQPAERVRTLWNMDSGSSDPEPVHIPEPSYQPDFTESRQNDSSCARSRGFTGQKTTQKLKEATKVGNSKVVQLKSLINRDLTLKEPKTKSCVHLPVHEAVLSTLSKRSLSPPSELPPKPSKRLIILAECKWESDSDRNYVLKKLCDSMAQDRLGDPFWIKKYLISPLSQTVEENGTNCCIQYKIHISSPKVEREKLTTPHKSQLQLIQKGSNKPQQRREGDTKPQQRREGDTKPQQRREGDTKPQQEQKQLGPLVHWQQEVDKEEELLEYWQREVEDDDIVEHDGYSLPQVDNKKLAITKKKNSMGLPFLTGISPAGFLLATRKKAGATDHLVQVNGKLYPLAKIQLGKMGALHPANRLAAYLTGRVGTNKDKQVSSPIPPQTAGLQDHLSTVHEAPEGENTRLNLVNIRPKPEVVASQVKLAPAADNSTHNDSQLNMSVVRTVNASEGSTSSKRSQMLMVEVLGPVGNIPVTNSTVPPSMSQRMVLKPVHTVSGVQYYRKPDGKLVQLVPVSQLRPGKPNLPVQKVLPPSHLQTPGVTVVKPTLPPTTVTPSSTSTNPSISTSTSFVSDLRSSPVSTSSMLTQAASSSLPQKGMSTFEFHSVVLNKEPIIITCPKVPLCAPSKDMPVQDAFLVPQPHPSPHVTSVKLASFKPSNAGGSEIGIKTVTAAPLGSRRVWAPKETPVTESCITETPTERGLTTITPDITPSLPPASGKSTSEPEVACGLVDLDIICVDDETMEMVKRGGSSSSETENSSDFESESDREKDLIHTKPLKRLLHNVLERKRRGQIMQLFEGLKKEVGLNHEKTSKISTLKKAVQVIEELRKTHRYLDMKKRRLMKKRDQYLSTIALTTDKRKIREQKICSGQRLHESVNKDRRRKDTTVVDLMKVVDMLKEMEEPTDNSTDEEVVVNKTTGIVTISNHKEDEVQFVAMETEEENSQLNMAQRRLAKMRTSSEISLSFKKTAKASRALSLPQTLLIEKAGEQIRTLQSETQTSDPNPQRDCLNTEFTQDSGMLAAAVDRDLMVLGKLWPLSSNQKEMEEEEEREGPPSQVPVSAGDGDSKQSPIGDATVDNVITSLHQHQTPQAPPTTVSIITPVQQPQVLLQLSDRVLVAPAPVPRDKPRTMPNILSRSKNPAPPLPIMTSTVEGKPPSFQALVPTEVLSLVGTALPGQSVLTLSPLIAGPTVLQTAPAPGMVSLNLPNLTNHQIHLAPLPCPPNATSFTNLLKLVQPTSKQQIHQVPTGQNPPLSPPSMASSQSNQIKDHNQPQSQTDPRPETSPPHSLQSLSSPQHPGLSKQDQLTEARAVSLDQRKETASLTSLLNEINFLNQTVPVATQAQVSSPGRWFSELEKAEQAHSHSPWALQLDSDSGETVTAKTQDVGFTEDQRATINRNSRSDVLAPPPLLQMNVGGATISDLPNSNGQAGGEGVGGRISEVGVAWRPMPRLVPLGLRGNQTS